MKRFGRIRSCTQSPPMTTWAFKSLEGMEDAGACKCARKRCMKCRLTYFSLYVGKFTKPSWRRCRISQHQNSLALIRKKVKPCDIRALFISRVMSSRLGNVGVVSGKHVSSERLGTLRSEMVTPKTTLHAHPYFPYSFTTSQMLTMLWSLP